jgi:hypothetical protein
LRGSTLKPGLDGLLQLIDRDFPLPARHKAALPDGIAELSRLLTSERSLREGGYMSRPGLRAAYLRYFLPWNVFKLTALFSQMEAEGAIFLNGGIAAENSLVIADLGSGPLTLPLALWSAFPLMRKKPASIYCVDKNARALEDGQKLFNAFANGVYTKSVNSAAGAQPHWNIKTIKADAAQPKLRQKAALVTAFNLYNEMIAGIPQGDTEALRTFARKTARTLANCADKNGSIFVGEPGTPACGQFLSLLRGAFLELGWQPICPCPHNGICPMPGGRKGAKWCHFVFDNRLIDAAPAALRALSKNAGLTKTRLTMSFVSFCRAENTAVKAAHNRLKMRVLSAPVRLPDGNTGVYACSSLGLALIRGKHPDTAPEFGALVERAVPSRHEYDKKTGALLV